MTTSGTTPETTPGTTTGSTDASPAGLEVVALIPTDPEQRSAVAGLLADLVAATQEEDGCLAYDAFESAVEPGLWITVETWRNQASLDAHMGTPHIAAAIEGVTPMLTGQIAIHPLRPLA